MAKGRDVQLQALVADCKDLLQQQRRGQATQLCFGVDAGQNIRKMVRDGFIIRKPAKIHSRARARRAAEAKAKGRHTGYGKRGLQLLVVELFVQGST